MGCCASKQRDSDDEELRRNAPRAPAQPPPMEPLINNENATISTSEVLNNEDPVEQTSKTGSIEQDDAADEEGESVSVSLQPNTNEDEDYDDQPNMNAAGPNGADDDGGTNAAAIIGLGAMTAVAGSVAFELINAAGMPRVVEPRQPVCKEPDDCNPCVIRNVENLRIALPDKRYVWVEDHDDHLSVNAIPNPDNSGTSIDARENYDSQGGFCPQRK